MSLTLLGHAAFALDVPDGTVVRDDGPVIISSDSNGNELNVEGTLDVSTFLIIGDYCYDTRAEVAESGLIEAGSIILGSGSRGCRLLIKDGGTVRTSSFSIEGDQTTGIPYSTLQNYVSVSGEGSRLEVAGLLDIWTPDAPGQPGDPYDIPRAIPAFLEVKNGAEVVTDSLSIANDSWLTIRAGGKLSILSDYDASEGRVYQMEDGTLSVGGELSGLTHVEAGRRVEAASVLGSLMVDGVFSGINADDMIAIQGDLVISEQGTLELSSQAGITVTGEATLGGMLRINMDAGPILSVGDQIQLFDFQAGVSGEFEGVEPLGDGSLQWDLSALNSTGVLSVIPEPATLTLIGLGGMLLALRRGNPAGPEQD
ncbi:PEP-CTERM sorting domain-containing protein [Pontiellaceae bacterium B12227]|nr:PEP-CTERM sorting domain-containing protein [Pontiellaceae bacterium B12227]